MTHRDRKKKNVDFCFYEYERQAGYYNVWIRGGLHRTFKKQGHAEVEVALTKEYFSWEPTAPAHMVAREKVRIWDTFLKILAERGMEV